MKKIITLSCILLTANFLLAQNAKIVTSGKIEFEKSINMYAIARQSIGKNPGALDQQIYDQYKAKAPQFAVLNSAFIFNNDKALFTPLDPVTPIMSFFGGSLIAKQFNTIYTDFATNSMVTQKKIYNDILVIKDSTRKITWHLTDETQEIAGYTCRRANALVLDSVYVVAFYTDKIWVSGGPESFGGLPGMILKLALPHDNIIWTATKVTVEDIPAATLTPPNPKNGKVMTNKQFPDYLKQYTKSWGSSYPHDSKLYSL
jgi:GLPGLI family protein